MSDFVWVADYMVRRRQRKLFEKDEMMRARMWGPDFMPAACFLTEREAREHIVKLAKTEVAKAERALKNARTALLRAEKKLAATEPEVQP